MKKIHFLPDWEKTHIRILHPRPTDYPKEVIGELVKLYQLLTRYPHLDVELLGANQDTKNPAYQLDDDTEIWLRDFCPLVLRDGSFLLYRSKDRSPEKMAQLARRIAFPYTEKPPRLIMSGAEMEGGNFTCNSEWVAKIRGDNDYWLAEHASLILLPHPNEQYVRHIDGFMRFVGEREVVFQVFSSQEYKVVDLALSTISYFIGDIDYQVLFSNVRSSSYSAFGCYVNFLLVKDLLVFPRFTDSRKEKELQKSLSKLYHSEIVSSEAGNLASLGGVFNCCTWSF